MNKRALTVVAALLLLGAAPGPKLSINSLGQLPIVTMHPYNESANANADVANAFSEARKTHKLLLIDLGGNWCPDCIVLANFMMLPDMHRFLVQHYELVMIDVGRFDKNSQIAARFGYRKRLEGVPAVLIATPDGKLLNRDHVFAYTDASHMRPNALENFLIAWAK